MQSPDPNETMERLRSIETMMAEGRRSTQRWGWSFLLWGIGPLIAMRWAADWRHPVWAWPVTMGLCAVVNGVAVKMRGREGQAVTAAMRSVGAVWTCAGTTVLLLAMGAIGSGATDFRYVCAGLFGLAAVAHGTSSMILRWRPQFLAALVWWTAAMLAYFVPAARLGDLAAGALLLGNVGFGGWLSYREWRGIDG